MAEQLCTLQRGLVMHQGHPKLISGLNTFPPRSVMQPEVSKTDDKWSKYSTISEHKLLGNVVL